MKVVIKVFSENLIVPIDNTLMNATALFTMCGVRYLPILMLLSSV